MANLALQSNRVLVPAAVAGPIREYTDYGGERTMRELSSGLGPDTLRKLDAVATGPVRLRKGETLFHAGEPFTALHAILQGSCKTTVLSEDGREQVIGFHMVGEVIGLDGIGTDRHGCGAVALEDAMTCAIPFDRLSNLARTSAALQHNINGLLSRGIGRGQDMMLLLGSMSAEERLAVLLLNLSDRYRQRGYSSTELVLRMSRQEIGSLLGLKLETVSRAFSRFHDQGLLDVQGRCVKLVAVAALKKIAGRRCRDGDFSGPSGGPVERRRAPTSSPCAPSCGE